MHNHNWINGGNQMKLIELSDIHKSYNEESGNIKSVLKGLDLTIEEGDMIAIMGSSGIGKSTLLHIIGCLDDPTCGIYKFQDMDVSNLNWNEKAKLRNQKIGFVLQDFGLIEYQTVLDNISIPLRFNADVKSSEIRKLAVEAMRQVGLDGYATEEVKKLSGGEKQRVAIARALVNNPSLILADEPTGALDEDTSEHIMKLFQELNVHGKTILIVTHDSMIASQCKTVLQMKDGILVKKDK